MKKSEIYKEAILAVLDDDTLVAPMKFEIVEQLMHDRSIAKLVEENEEDKF